MKAMKALLHSAWIVSLGLLTAQAFAQDMPWRPASPSSGAAHTIQPPPGADTAPVMLGRPSPLAAPQPDMRSVDFRPVVRAKSHVAEFPAYPTTPRPLPNSPLRVSDTVQTVEPEKVDARKPPLTTEVVPFPPTPVGQPGPIVSGAPVYGDCCPQTVVCRDRCWGLGLGRCWSRCFSDCCPPVCCPPACCPPACCPPVCCPALSCAPECCIEDCCGGCELDCWGCCCAPRPCFWASAEYLLWGLREARVPPLVTTSPAGTPVTNAGVLGQPTTTVLFGDRSLDNNLFSGGRFTIGFWLPCYSDIGLEATYFFLGERNGRFSAQSGGNPILARPFVDAVTGNEVTQLVAFPDLIAGQVNVDWSTRLWGVEANFRHKLCCGPCFHLDLLYGYRHLQLDDSLTITENLSLPLGNDQFLGIGVRDSFTSSNTFNGAQVGLELEHRLFRRWFLNWHGKVAFGSLQQSINVEGSTLFSSVAPGVANPQPAGVAALPTNIGHHSRDRFAVLPELGVKIGIDVTENLRLWIGYDVLWLTNTVRAGEQYDRTINRSQLPTNINGIGPLVGPARPLVPFRTQDFWAQGLNFGLQYRY